MKRYEPQRCLARELAAGVPCAALRDRRCLRRDGEPKQWYTTLSAAKANTQKHQRAYPCPSGDGFHIGSPMRS